MAALVHEAKAENGFSLGTLSRLVGKEDAVAASRTFDAEDPSTALRLVAALLVLDAKHHWLRGVCRLVGGEFVERPRLTPEQKLARLTETLRRHGAMGEALISEALGDAP